MDTLPPPAGARGWPPLIATAVAFVLVFLILPNPLRVPQNNPTAAAEYAPVPGNEQAAENANFSEANAATSAGIGSGGEGSGALPGSPPPPPPPQFKPRDKNCVGNPPRQTEDPLSPPCVPFYDGDNGGRTYRGVTRDEIRVAYYNDDGVNKDLTKPYKPSDDGGNQADYYQYNHVRTVKALLRYFQTRYQTYGRRVKMTGYASQSGRGTPPSGRQGDALAIVHDIDPFAVAVIIENAQEAGAMWADPDFKIPSFGWNEDVPLEVYTKNAPYMWSFVPDQATETTRSASFICRKLKGNTAKFTDDPTLKGNPRTFGLTYPKGTTQRGPYLDQLAQLLKKELRAQCNMTFEFEATFTANGQTQAGTIMQQMKNRDITTVVCYCIPQINELTIPAMQNAATGIAYFPEWYWDYASAMDRGLWQQEYGSRQHKGFGVSNLWRQPAFTTSFAYQAYLSEEPGTQPNLRWNFEVYHVFLNLFEGIQAAGPTLTPETVERGMFTFRYQNPANPWVPTGSYGPSGPSLYTFIDTAMGFWWDPDGTPPGGHDREGCVRVMYGGRRFYAGEWPEGDADIMDPRDPCSADTRRMVQ